MARKRYVTCGYRCSTTVGNWHRAKRAYESVRQMSEAERAWLAAAIDGEGCISYTQTYPRITIVNTSLPFLQRAREFTDIGRIAERRKDKEHHQRQWSWIVDGYAAIAVLEQVGGWLVIKQDKAAAAMAIRLDSIEKLDRFMRTQEG